jgi:hypothetical protein
MDRTSNTVIFRLTEDRDVAMRRVDAVHYSKVTDDAVDVVDVFRVGRFDANKIDRGIVTESYGTNI